MFKLQISTDNDAFTDGKMFDGLSDALRQAALDVLRGKTNGDIRDANGNLVGRFGMVPDRKPRPTITVSTFAYQAAHGHRPRGIGQWSFTLHGAGPQPWSTEYWAPSNLSYTRALSFARKAARENICTSIVVNS